MNNPKDIDKWRAQESRGGLKPYPSAPPGTLNPAGGLSQFGGGSSSSFSGPDLGMPFAQWRSRMEKQRPQADGLAQKALASRYRLDCATGKATMSRGKPVPVGPTARLAQGIMSFEDLAARSPEQIRAAGLFPYPPLDHPLQSTAHMVFPKNWTKVHPEHERFDVGHDLPDCYLPEFPPPLYLTTHPEMGDVSRGVEITYGNYFDIFNGLFTPEQLDGLRVLVTPFQTTWFNATLIESTAEPSQGVSCFACHVNGHSQRRLRAGAGLAGRTTRAFGQTRRPCAATTRSCFSLPSAPFARWITSRRVEEYFDGDTAHVGGASAVAISDSAETNHMGDFNAIIDFPPAPKLDVSQPPDPRQGDAKELRGEALFEGKGAASTAIRRPRSSPTTRCTT